MEISAPTFFCSHHNGVGNWEIQISFLEQIYTFQIFLKKFLLNCIKTKNDIRTLEMELETGKFKFHFLSKYTHFKFFKKISLELHLN